MNIEILPSYQNSELGTIFTNYTYLTLSCHIHEKKKHPLLIIVASLPGK